MIFDLQQQLSLNNDYFYLEAFLVLNNDYFYVSLSASTYFVHCAKVLTY